MDQTKKLHIFEYSICIYAHIESIDELEILQLHQTIYSNFVCVCVCLYIHTHNYKPYLAPLESDLFIQPFQPYIIEQ